MLAAKHVSWRACFLLSEEINEIIWQFVKKGL